MKIMITFSREDAWTMTSTLVFARVPEFVTGIVGMSLPGLNCFLRRLKVSCHLRIDKLHREIQGKLVD